MKWKLAVLATTTSLLLATGCGTAQVPNSTSGSSAGTSGNTTAVTTNVTSATQGSGNTTNTASTTSGSSNELSPLLNKQAPNFTMAVYGSNGKTMSLKQILAKGQPVILNAFASWCPPCNLEAPDLKKLQTQYQGKITVVGVDMTNYDTLAGLKTFVAKYGLQYTVLTDQKSVFANEYDVAAYPTTFGLSASGKVIAFHLGYMSQTDMQNMAKKLLTTS